MRPALEVRALGRSRAPGAPRLGFGPRRGAGFRRRCGRVCRRSGGATRCLAVPHLGLIRPWLARRARIAARFDPGTALAGAPFHVAGAAAMTTLLRDAESLC